MVIRRGILGTEVNDMIKMSYAVKVDPKLIKKIKQFCLGRGIKQGFFVEKALREQLAREELAGDLMDFKNLRLQESSAMPLDQYLKGKASQR